MRRQTAVGRVPPAGSSRDERLDPFSLPVRFAVSDRTADERLRVVELSRDHVVLRRAVRGIKMAITVRIAAYLGVAIRIEPPQDGQGGAVAVVLEHRDPGLSLSLYRASDGNDIVAEWQSWGRALCLPLLIVDSDGSLREPFARLGAVRVAAPTWRRRRRSALRARRPTLSLRRRRVHKTTTAPAVYRDEREIIARN